MRRSPSSRAARLGGADGRLLARLGERASEPPARAHELATGSRQAAAHTPDVADRPERAAEAPSAPPPFRFARSETVC